MEDPKTLPAEHSIERKPYQPPLLIQYGSIQDLTRDGAGGLVYDGTDYQSSPLRWGE